MSRFSDELERWLSGDGDKTLGSLVDLFGQRSFAVMFVLLLGVPALPLPTGGATHLFELIAMLLSLQLIAGRDQIWLPKRWCALSVAGPRQQRFIEALLQMVRRLERLSRRRQERSERAPEGEHTEGDLAHPMSEQKAEAPP